MFTSFSVIRVTFTWVKLEFKMTGYSVCLLLIGIRVVWVILFDRWAWLQKLTLKTFWQISWWYVIRWKWFKVIGPYGYLLCRKMFSYLLRSVYDDFDRSLAHKLINCAGDVFVPRMSRDIESSQWNSLEVVIHWVHQRTPWFQN